MKILKALTLTAACLIVATGAVTPALAQTDYKTVFTSGSNALNAKDYKKAIVDFTEVIRLNKNIPGAFFNRAIASLALNDNPNTISDTTECIRLCGKEENFRSMRIGALENRAIAYDRSSQLALAVADFGTMIELEPSNSRTWRNRAIVYGEMGEYEKAVADAEKSYSLDSKTTKLTLNKDIMPFNAAIAKSPNDPKGYDQRGMKWLDLGKDSIKKQSLFDRDPKLQSAMDDFDKAIALNPNYAEALYHRGLARELSLTLKLTGADDEQIKYYDRAIAANPQYADALLARGKQRAKILFSKPEDVAQATSDLDAAIKYGVSGGEAHFLRGKLYFDAKDYDNAVKLYNEAIRRDTKNPEYYAKRADLYEQRKDFKWAIEDRTTVLSLVPGEDSLRQRAMTEALAKDYKGAIADWTSIIGLKPAAYNYARRGDMHLEAKDYPNAFADYDKAISLEPDDADHYLGRAKAHRVKGEKALALADYRKAHEVDDAVPMIAADLSNFDAVDKDRNSLKRSFAKFGKQNDKLQKAAADLEKAKEESSKSQAELQKALEKLVDPDADELKRIAKAIDDGKATADDYTKRADIYFKQKKNESALDNIAKAILVDPNFARAYFVRGVHYYNSDQYNSALIDLNKAIELAPKVAYYHYVRGSIYKVQKDPNQAIANYDKALSLDGKLMNALAARGDVRYDQKDYAKAFIDYDNMIFTDPKSALGYFKRGNANFQLGQFARSVADYDKALELDPKMETAKSNRDIAKARLPK